MFDEFNENENVLSILAILQNWAAKLPRNVDESIEECYVFGSLVNMEGAAFHPQESDIDLIIVTSESNPQQLVRLLGKLAPKVDELEKLLKKELGNQIDELDKQNNESIYESQGFFKKLLLKLFFKKSLEKQRDKPITDITLVTSFEQEEGIHKERNSKISFALQAFLPLIQPTDQLQDMGDKLAEDLLDDFPRFSAWTVIANAQLQRYKFFRKGRDGKLVDYDGIHVLPKELLRNAYTVSLLERDNPKPNFSKEDDLFAGLAFLLRELKEEEKSVQEAKRLLRLIQIHRQGGRGVPKPVEVNLLLYAWELIRHRAQRSLVHHRDKKKSQEKNEYAAKWVLDELVSYHAESLKCINTAIELYSGPDLVGSQSTIPVAINSAHPYNEDLHEIESPNQDQLDKLSKEWPDDIPKHLQEKARSGKKVSDKFECKVGFEQIDFSKRGMTKEENPSLSIRPLNYWVTLKFNKELAKYQGQNEYHKRLRKQYAERLFVSTEDFYCECPSQLFLEVAVITKDDRVPILLKDATQSVMAQTQNDPVPKDTAQSVMAQTQEDKKEAKTTIRTCGPEYGFVWSQHVEEISGNPHLNIEKALQDALKNELGIKSSEILSWEISSFTIQHLHLNSALLGVVKIDLPTPEFTQRLKAKKKYHAGVEKFLNKHQLFKQIESDFNEKKWHGTGLMRLALAADYLKTAPM